MSVSDGYNGSGNTPIIIPPEVDNVYKIKINNKEISKWLIVKDGSTLNFKDISATEIAGYMDATEIDVSDFPTLPIAMLHTNGSMNMVSYDIPATCEINLITNYDYYKDTAVF